MRMTTSFTGPRGVRYPAPDVARGFMLLLIAVANVPSWNKMPNGAEPPASSVDAWWMFVRALVVDHRAYPLFAMLFGFGHDHDQPAHRLRHHLLPQLPARSADRPRADAARGGLGP